MAEFKARHPLLEAIRVQELGPDDEPGDIFYLIEGPAGLAQIDVETFEALYAPATVAAPTTPAAPKKKPSGWQVSNERAKPKTAAAPPRSSEDQDLRDPLPSTLSLADYIRLAIKDGPKKITEIRGWMKWRGFSYNADAVAVALQDLVMAGELRFDSDVKLYDSTKKLQSVQGDPFNERNQTAAATH